MKKRIIFFIGTILLLSTIAIGWCFYNYEKYQNTNTIIHRVNAFFLDLNEVSIQGLENNDLLTNIDVVWIWEGKKETIIKDGKQVTSLKNKYGLHNFKIFFKKKEICKLSYQKSNWWYIDKYIFTITQKNNGISCNCERERL